MRKKILFLFILFVLSVGHSVQAKFVIPFFDITIVKQSIGGDATFNFDYNDSYPEVYGSQNFQIQTVNGIGSYSTSTIGGFGTEILLIESPLLGWQNTGVSCESDSSGVTTYPTDGGILIHTYPYASITCTFTNTKQVENPDPVIIIPGILGSAEKNGVWLIDPIFHTYDDLIATLAANGFVEGQDLFTFPYDWRFSNILTAVALKDKIAEVKVLCQCDKVDLVAHSMGGLVARQYIQSSRYANDIDQLIFLGTPHLGAPKAYYSWGGATVPPNDPVYSVIKFMLWSEAFKLNQNLFDYIHQSVLSIRELLPIYDYLTLNDTGVIEHYPNGYPTNPFLENLSAGTDTLLNSGVEIVNIIGNTGNSTITSISVASSTDAVLWEHGEPVVESYGEGDATVPVSSAEFIQDGLVVVNAKHLALPDVAEQEVYELLTGKLAETLVKTWWDFVPNIKMLLIKILSPADIQVIAPDGSIVGKDFVTGQEINQIPGAFYSGFGTDDEYVTIPNPLPGNYTVKTVGTGSGSYTVATGLISNTSSEEKEVTGTTAPGFVANVEVGVSDDGTLEILPPDAQTITPDLVIADIELAYANGWLKDKQTKNKLIKGIKAMVKIEKKIAKLKMKVNGKNIEKKVERLEIKVDKVLAKTLETELKLYNKNKILTDEGFNLIKNDIELLMLVY